MVERKALRFVKIVETWGIYNLRIFPWRSTKNPYKILIAEIMLQRTRAEQVVPIYKRFIDKYPDPFSLSETTLIEIERDLFPLGLKKRGQNINKLAEQLTTIHNGKVPNNKEDLLKLCGVGNYIANAVLNNAFGLAVPTVDVNFARIVVRVFSLYSKYPFQKNKEVWEFAEYLISIAGNSGRIINLAILDIGSSICTAKKPLCKKCPLCQICDYSKENRLRHLP